MAIKMMIITAITAAAGTHVMKTSSSDNRAVPSVHVFGDFDHAPVPAKAPRRFNFALAGFALRVDVKG